MILFVLKVPLSLSEPTNPSVIVWFMVALCNRKFVGLFCLLFFFPRLISAAADWMSAILPHMVCGLSANLRCRSETCCTRLAENTGCKKVAKNRHLGIIAQLCRTISSQLRHVSTIRKKNLLSSNMSSTCPSNMVNFGLLAAKICWPVWGTPANFNGFLVLAALFTARHLVVGVSHTLRRWIEGATYIRQGDHQVGHWPTFLVT